MLAFDCDLRAFGVFLLCDCVRVVYSVLSYRAFGAVLMLHSCRIQTFSVLFVDLVLQGDDLDVLARSGSGGLLLGLSVRIDQLDALYCLHKLHVFLWLH